LFSLIFEQQVVQRGRKAATKVRSAAAPSVDHLLCVESFYSCGRHALVRKNLAEETRLYGLAMPSLP
jgi:hypothetical protein